MSEMNRGSLPFIYNQWFITDKDPNPKLRFVFLCGCNALSHISESVVLIENNSTQPKGVDIYLLLLCCDKFYEQVRESFYKKSSIRRCKRLVTADTLKSKNTKICCLTFLYLTSCIRNIIDDLIDIEELHCKTLLLLFLKEYSITK